MLTCAQLNQESIKSQIMQCYFCDANMDQLAENEVKFVANRPICPQCLAHSNQAAFNQETAKANPVSWLKLILAVIALIFAGGTLAWVSSFY